MGCRNMSSIEARAGDTLQANQGAFIPVSAVRHPAQAPIADILSQCMRGHARDLTFDPALHEY
jgi:hypothetical protein